LLHAARGRFLQQLGRVEEAREAYGTALRTAALEPEKRFLRTRIAGLQGICVPPGPPLESGRAAAGTAEPRTSVRAASSADGGISCATTEVVLITEGSSRSLTNNAPFFGCGTGMADPKKPSGTFTG